MRFSAPLLQAALASIGEGVVIANAKGRLVLFNDAAQRFFDHHLMSRHPHPHQWPRTFGLFMADQKTPFPMEDLPLIRAIQGLNTDGLELFVRNRRVPSGAWINLSGRPLKSAQGKIIGGVAVFRDITEFKKAEQEIVEISGREQRRIGQDLHDGLGQTLLAAQFTSRVLAARLEEKKIRKARECLQEVEEHIHNALAQADVIARGLYPVELDIRGLMAALQELCRNMARIYRIRCRFFCPTPVQISNATTASHLYRIAQEAVFNAIKNGKARSILIRLDQQTASIRLAISDNGIGISNAPKRKGMGLVLMAYRARMINASLQIQRRRTGGTQVLCVAHSGLP